MNPFGNMNPFGSSEQPELRASVFGGASQLADLEDSATDRGEPSYHYEVPAVFLDPAADVLIKSSNGYLFKVHKAILTTGSTFFSDMFLHPRPPTTQDGAEEPIEWSESAETITALLYRLYPIPNPMESTVDDLLVLVAAADKWGMDGLLERAKAELTKPTCLESRPLAIYKLACRLGDSDLQQVASRRLVELYDPLDNLLRQDLDTLSAWDFVRLCDLRKAREVQGIARSVEWYLVPEHRGPCWKWIRTRLFVNGTGWRVEDKIRFRHHCGGVGPHVPHLLTLNFSQMSGDATSTETPPFEVPIVFLDADGDLLLSSSDGVHFKVFKSFLIFGSQFFRDMFKHSKPTSGNSDEPVVWDEPAELITSLLYQLYPIAKPDLTDLSKLERVLEAADKWGMDRVFAQAKAELQTPRFLDVRPVAVSRLAARLGMDDVRDKAIRRLVELYDPMDASLRPQLGDITALELLTWCDLHKKRMAAVKAALDKNFQCYGNKDTTAKRLRARAEQLIIALETVTSSTTIAPATRARGGCQC
ncbi:hypothetical protein CALCODRAFT_556884 [Calocera cornea HHB12733]|uniref:BTB domain-containing protein n=1 Tax=Calocera cornea HHB12733 TaxID=1353952 RepID=A0A165ED44_9BASI|nr:hypothetical protein CALCODRAFT_556884 [Calocera cornea HHB12733]